MIFDSYKHAHLLAQLKLVVFDFDGVFTDNTVYVNQDGLEQVRCWRSDGLGLSRLKATGVSLQILSTETNTVVALRSAKLKIPCRQGVEDKAKAVVEICQQNNTELKECMFVGNDINDIPAFGKVGIPVGVADAYPEVNPHILFRTAKPGGFGAVREICDLICECRKAMVPLS